MKSNYTVVKHEAVGVFDSYEQLHDTIKELETSGIGRRQISVRGSDAAVKREYGESTVIPERLEDDPNAPHSPIIGAEELGVAQGVLIGIGMYVGAALAFYALPQQATTSSVVIALLATLAGAGIGAVLARVLGTQYRFFFKKQEAEGGLVLWIETPNTREVQKVESILLKNGAHHIHTHDIPVAA